MSDTFLATEDILQSLMEELEHFQAASEKLTLTERDVAELIDATRQLTAQFRKVVSFSEQQVDTITELQAYTEERVSRVIHQQQESMKPLEVGIKTISSTLVHQEDTIRSVINQVNESRQVLDALAGSIGIHEQKLSQLANALDSAHAALAAQMDWLTRLEDYDSRVVVEVEELRNTLLTTAAGVSANEQKLTVVADALLAAHTMLNAQTSRLDSVDTRMASLGTTADQVNDMQRLARMNRVLLVLVLILVLVSAGLGGYLVWLTLL